MNERNTSSIKRCEPAPSGITAPKIVPIINNDEKIPIRDAKALVGYMSFNRLKSASVSEVRRSSASIAGWSKFYSDHIQNPEIQTEKILFLTPCTSPNEDSPQMEVSIQPPQRCRNFGA